MLHALVELLGSLALLLLLIYAAGFWVYEKVRKPETPTAVDPKHMPVMQPIPIPTKHHASNLMKLLVMLFEVRRWQICRNWLFLYRPRHGEPVLLVIPEGFRFDGASIPRPFWSLLSPIGLLLIPGLVHDYGYRYDQAWRIDDQGRVVPWQKGAGKTFWDQVFLDVGRQVNGFAIIDAIAWFALKLAGERAWKANRRRHESIKKPELSDQERERAMSMLASID